LTCGICGKSRILPPPSRVAACMIEACSGDLDATRLDATRSSTGSCSRSDW
jgi:hypothetical protein